MLRLGTVVMGAADVERAVAFWSAVFDFDVVRFDGAADDFTILVPPDGEGTRIAFQLTATPPEEHPRTHIDLVVDTADEQTAEVERLIALGAQRVDWDLYPDDPDFVVLADPEGNRFCVIDASHS